ncbi:hypothetical protein BU25DRAFT_421635 [Macroventuria anomochaeta]|uniref:Uncharacterized protein n=1 Tax=Macroventuria anomochaeta TaxID=301207 RepID=A0ACB6S044_9PLEO|nr:uncharacterized protein BU25DRAFT_421635 [Macroventuria anomochaeta]KAF2627651.1 hypothetical protein BU25DRAFT_421635 [Macroventuria anomochaeta]
MSLFPNILHPSTYSTLLGDRPKITTTPSQKDHETEQQRAHQVDHHHISAFLISFLSHMFAPAAYQQCTSSTPCWAVSHHSECLSKSSDKAVIIVDDEFVLLEDRDSEEQDGGPICQEATIESWKAPKKGLKRYGDARRWSDLPYFGCS